MRTLLLASLIALATPALTFAETITAKVLGMTCETCAAAIEKTFANVDAVQNVKIDLDKKLVTLVLKPKAKLADAVVTKKITSVGYKVVKISRTA